MVDFCALGEKPEVDNMSFMLYNGICISVYAKRLL